MKIGTAVKVKVGSHPAKRGVIAGKAEDRSNGKWFPVNFTPKDVKKGTPKDIRYYRGASLTVV